MATFVKRTLNEGLQTLTLNSALMRRPSPPGQPTGFRPDGGNLPWVVEEVRRRAPGRIQEWIVHLRTALPDLEDLRTVERPEDRHRYLLVCYQGGLVRSGWESRPESACCLCPREGKSKAARGENLVGRTVWRTEKSVCTHFSNQVPWTIPACTAADTYGAYQADEATSVNGVGEVPYRCCGHHLPGWHPARDRRRRYLSRPPDATLRGRDGGRRPHRRPCAGSPRHPDRDAIRAPRMPAPMPQRHPVCTRRRRTPPAASAPLLRGRGRSRPPAAPSSDAGPPGCRVPSR